MQILVLSLTFFNPEQMISLLDLMVMSLGFEEIKTVLCKVPTSGLADKGGRYVTVNISCFTSSINP